MDTVSANTRVDAVAQPELFVAYAESDADWVHGFLLPELGLAPRSVLAPRDFTPGAMLVTELERAVETTQRTLVVLSRPSSKATGLPSPNCWPRTTGSCAIPVA